MAFVNQVLTGGYDDEMDLPEYGEIADVPVETTASHERQELMHEEHEKNANDLRLRSARWEGQDRWKGKENEEMRMVNVMHCNTFIAKLRAAGISADLDNACVDEWVREMNLLHPKKDYEIIGNGGPKIWLNSFSRVGRIGVNAWTKAPRGSKAFDMGMFIAKTVTTLQYPWSIEWSIMRFDEYEVPTAEKYRGWRTTLLDLIKKNVLTEEEAHRAFGAPHGQASLFYRKQLYNHRNSKPVEQEPGIAEVIQ